MSRNVGRMLAGTWTEEAMADGPIMRVGIQRCSWASGRIGRRWTVQKRSSGECGMASLLLWMPILLCKAAAVSFVHSIDRLTCQMAHIFLLTKLLDLLVFFALQDKTQLFLSTGFLSKVYLCDLRLLLLSTWFELIPIVENKMGLVSAMVPAGTIATSVRSGQRLALQDYLLKLLKYIHKITSTKIDTAIP